MVSQEGIGYLAVAVAVVCFGSNFVPVKKYETGDGMFFQWILCTSVWVFGCLVNVVRTSYSDQLLSSIAFYPYAMLGGFLWTIGNATAVTIIKCIGLGLGMCIWGSVNLMMGWASGTFGLFGLHKETVPNPALNYCGAALAIVGVVVFVFVKSESQQIDSNVSEENVYLIQDPSKRIIDNSNQTQSFVDAMPEAKKRILGIGLAMISGFFYGINFDPPQYILDHSPGLNSINLAFSHFSGIFFTSTLLLIIYCVVKKNNPDVYPKAILPGIFSGVLWAIAQCCWFIANEKLELVIAFPIIATGPGLIASLWSVVVFKEIKGRRNFMFLGLGFAIVITAVVLIALSKS